MATIKTLSKETSEAKIYDVQADSYEDFLQSEIAERIEEIDEFGPFSENQQIPFITHKQNIPIYIILAGCIIAHLWAYINIGM